MKPQYIKIDEDGNKFYYSDKKMKILHREDGPAVEWSNGDKYWYLNGKLHCQYGPATEWSNGYKEWFLNGIKYSEADFNKKMNPTQKIIINERQFIIERLNDLIKMVKKS